MAQIAPARLRRLIVLSAILPHLSAEDVRRERLEVVPLQELLIRIADNAALTDVSGLSALTSVGGDFTIEDNVSLCQSDVTALLERLYDYLGTVVTTFNKKDC